MAGEDWALLIALASLAISLFNFGWNIWSKWIYPKPKVMVSFSVKILIQETTVSPSFLAVSAINFGPTETTLKQLVARSLARGWWHKWGSDRWKIGIMNHMKTPEEAISASFGRFGALHHKLSVGEEFQTYLVFKHQHLRDDDILDVGFVDIFDRVYWAPRKEVRAVIKNIRKEWPKV